MNCVARITKNRVGARIGKDTGGGAYQWAPGIRSWHTPCLFRATPEGEESLEFEAESRNAIRGQCSILLRVLEDNGPGSLENYSILQHYVVVVGDLEHDQRIVPETGIDLLLRVCSKMEEQIACE